ncbi:MAG: hypothetical protein V1725_05310 [archaeon]
MAIELLVNGKLMIIHDDVIDRDIAEYERRGESGRLEHGVYVAPRPNVHGMLVCLRDLRKYDSQEIQTLCLDACPHPKRNNPVADDGWHLDDCWEHLFNAVSLDGKTVYVEYKE